MLYLDCLNPIGEPIESTGYKTDINMSSIYTKLIQEAGRYCEYYASDILIDIETVKECIADKVSGSHYFGFREMGVDHEAFIVNRSRDEAAKYRAIYRLDLKFNSEQEILAKLQKVEYSLWKHDRIVG